MNVLGKSLKQQEYTHTLIVKAVWYSKLDVFDIIEGVRLPVNNYYAGRDNIYHYEVPITLSEKQLLEKMDIEELHSSTHYEVASFIIDWCYDRYKLTQNTFKEET